jgi:chromosome segregation ATPase
LTRWVLVVIIGAVAGCASSSSPPRPAATLLVQADRLAAQGQYAGALEAYGDIVAKYPQTEEAGRARSSRELVASLVAARAQIARLTTEMKTQDTQLKTMEAELTRVRAESAARDGELTRARQEITRLTAEAERLRADLENLKKIDIDLERRRK